MSASCGSGWRRGGRQGLSITIASAADQVEASSHRRLLRRQRRRDTLPRYCQGRRPRKSRDCFKTPPSAGHAASMCAGESRSAMNPRLTITRSWSTPNASEISKQDCRDMLSWDVRDIVLFSVATIFNWLRSSQVRGRRLLRQHVQFLSKLSLRTGSLETGEPRHRSTARDDDGCSKHFDRGGLSDHCAVRRRRILAHDSRKNRPDVLNRNRHRIHWAVAELCTAAPYLGSATLRPFAHQASSPNNR